MQPPKLRIATPPRFDYNWYMTVITAGSVRQKAFSLIELMLVIALMAVASAMLFSFASGSHQRSQKQLCSDNLEKTYLALQIYDNDFGFFPKNTNAQTSEQVLEEL